MEHAPARYRSLLRDIGCVQLLLSAADIPSRLVPLDICGRRRSAATRQAYRAPKSRAAHNSRENRTRRRGACRDESKPRDCETSVFKSDLNDGTCGECTFHSRTSIELGGIQCRGRSSLRRHRVVTTSYRQWGWSACHCRSPAVRPQQPRRQRKYRRWIPHLVTKSPSVFTKRKSPTSAWRHSMCSTRKTPDCSEAAKSTQVFGGAVAVADAAAEAAEAAEAAGAAEVAGAR